MSERLLLDWANVVACAVLLAYGFFVCYVMPHRGMWVRRLVVWCVVAALGIQCASPWIVELPYVTWYGAVLHASMAVAILLWHRSVVRVVVSEFLSSEDLSTVAAPLDDSKYGALCRARDALRTARRRFLRKLRDGSTG